eukprot:SAG31_NODE_326_length_17664_cov_10.038543_17_plen_83_part_00
MGSPTDAVQMFIFKIGHSISCLATRTRNGEHKNLQEERDTINGVLDSCALATVHLSHTRESQQCVIVLHNNLAAFIRPYNII